MINGIDSNVFISKAVVGKIPFINEYAFPVVSKIIFPYNLIFLWELILDYTF